MAQLLCLSAVSPLHWHSRAIASPLSKSSGLRGSRHMRHIGRPLLQRLMPLPALERRSPLPEAQNSFCNILVTALKSPIKIHSNKHTHFIPARFSLLCFGLFSSLLSPLFAVGVFSSGAQPDRPCTELPSPELPRLRDMNNCSAR